MNVVEQFVDCGCQGNSAVWEMEYRRGYAPSWNGWVFLEESAQRGAGVTDRGWYCAVQYTRAHIVLCRKWVDAICCALVGWVSTLPCCAIFVKMMGCQGKRDSLAGGCLSD